MTREEITQIFDGATDDQINQLLSINTADLTAVQGELQQAQQDLTAARTTITRLEASANDATALQEQLEQYRQAEAARQEAEQQAAAQSRLEARLNAVTGERKYLNEYVRRGVLEDFAKAIGDAANTGKSDAEIFAVLTKDQNLFQSMNPGAGSMAQFGATGGENLDSLSDAEYYARVFNAKK